MKFFHKNNFKFKKAIYPAIIGIFIIAGIFVFAYSARFLSGAVNKAFFVDNEIVESKMIKIDIDNLTKIASKLNIQFGETGINVFSSSSSSSVSSESATSSSSIVATSPIVELDKKSVKIAIYNGTNKKGVAAELKNILVEAGFTAIKTANLEASPPSGGEASKLTIKIKNSKKDYLPLVKESVLKKYATIEDKEMDETGEYDIIITIGGK